MPKRRAGLKRVAEAFWRFYKKGHEANPKWYVNVLTHVLISGANSLREMLEDDNEPEVTWANPYVRMIADVDLDYFLSKGDIKKTILARLKNLSPETIKALDTMNREEPSLPEEFNEATAGALSNAEMAEFLVMLSGGVMVFRREGQDEEELVIPDEAAKLHEGKEAKDYIESKIIGYTSPGMPDGARAVDPAVTLDFDGYHEDERGKKRKVQGSLLYYFSPIIVEYTPGVLLPEVYAEITVGLTFTGYSPQRWTKEDRDRLWEDLYAQLRKDEPPEDMSFIHDPAIWRLEGTKVEAVPHFEKQYKHSRSFFRTGASAIGRDKRHRKGGGEEAANTQISLYHPPALAEGSIEDKVMLRAAMSKMVALTGSYLMQEWQSKKNAQGLLVIDNLSEAARALGIQREDFKIYLIYLGGYVHNLVTTKESKKGKGYDLVITNDKLFSIRFYYHYADKEVADRQADELVTYGTKYLNFLRDTPVDRIEVKPNLEFIAELEDSKHGLGSVRVTDKFISFALGLSDMACKLLLYTSAQKPEPSGIGFDKLIQEIHLRLGEAVKTQGKPRVLQSIKDGFSELEEAGHIEWWRYEEEREIFKWRYTDKFVKHPELRAKN